MSGEKEYKVVTVVVRTFLASNDELESETIKIIDDVDRRKWLATHTMWAIMNGRYVEIVNKNDDKPE